MLLFSDALNQISGLEYRVLLFHCPVAKGCAAGFFSVFKRPLSIVSLSPFSAPKAREG